MNSPWGTVQGSETLADGITQVYTAGHGGIKLSPARQKQLLLKGVKSQSNFLKSDQWWEEDCDWAIPFVNFADDIKSFGTVTGEQFEFTLKAAKASIEYWVNK